MWGSDGVVEEQTRTEPNLNLISLSTSTKMSGMAWTTTDAESAGLLALFALALGDALGVPVPGDSALVVAGGLAAEGRFALPAVIGVASIAALLGDAIAYEAGRRGGRRLLQRDGPLAAHRRAVLRRAERLYARHGALAVFVAKFIPGVRAVSAVTAGSAGMPRSTFAAIDALACLSWTTATASIAYAAGPTGALVLVVTGLLLTAAGLAIGAARRGRRAPGTGSSGVSQRTPVDDPVDRLRDY